jgi:predicted NBD/HSP70 family sugar kinase
MSSLSPFLLTPRIVPELDPGFRPAALAHRVFAAVATEPVSLAIEQIDGSVFHHPLRILSATHPAAAEANPYFVERTVKFLLWGYGGWRIHVAGPESLVAALRRHYAEDAPGEFDSEIIGQRIYDRPIEALHVASAAQLPVPKATTAPLGRHWNGCRIGFDLGGSDRKVAAVVDGECVFTEETVWDPYFQPDINYHLDGIRDSLRKAAAHLPRVDGIGGSAAGVYVNNRVKVASLFRGVSREVFDARAKELFLELRKEWGGIPFEVVNDGEVAALAAAMSLGVNSVLGLAMGTSTAAGFVNAEGNITSWLNELAFTPFDYSPTASREEWSGDVGVGASYFSQQAVGRLLAPAGIEVDSKLGLPEKLKHVQALMEEGDPRAARIYDTLGIFLGYGLAHAANFYRFENVLVLGRVTTGTGGERMLEGARKVLDLEFPELARQVKFQVPDEKEKRHGQAIAAASLPVVG